MPYKKLHNISLPIIESVSSKSHYYVEKCESQQYITLININYYKGGWMLPELLELEL